MEDTFKAFLWFGAALALVIVGTMAMLGSLSLGELSLSRKGELTREIATLKSLIRESQFRAERHNAALQLLRKRNAESELRVKERLEELAYLEQYEDLEEVLLEAEKTRDALIDEYAQKRAEILKKVRGTTIERFTTAKGRSFKNVTINGDDGKRVSLRSEFGGRALTYDELSSEMQAVMGISPVIEDIRASLGEKPEVDTKLEVVAKRVPTQTEEESEFVAAIRIQKVTAEERYKRLQRSIARLLSEANRLEAEESQKKIKSADVRSKVSAMREEAKMRRAEVLVVSDEINKLNRQLNSGRR